MPFKYRWVGVCPETGGVDWVVVSFRKCDFAGTTGLLPVDGQTGNSVSLAIFMAYGKERGGIGLVEEMQGVTRQALEVRKSST